MFRIGFPLDAEERSHYTIVHVIRNHYHTCLGCGYSNELPKDSGAKFVWEKTPLEFRKYNRFQFAIFPESIRTPTTTPTNMFTEGNSDFAACALGLAQNLDSKQTEGSPLVLISCSYKLPPDYNHENLQDIYEVIQNIALGKVTSENTTMAAQSLLHKWNAACQGQALALVLHETDANILHKALSSQQQNPNEILPICSLQPNTFELLKQNKPNLPVIVSVKANDFTSLANALEIKKAHNIALVKEGDLPVVPLTLEIKKSRIFKVAVLSIAMLLLLFVVWRSYQIWQQTSQTDCSFSALHKAQSHPMRFSIAENKVITDLQTKLQWYLGPDQPTTWEEANIWAAQLEIDGGGWCMPTLFELQNLNQKDIGLDSQFELNKNQGFIHIWSCEPYGTDAAGAVFFDGSGSKKMSYGWTFTNIPYLDSRAFAVRHSQFCPQKQANKNQSFTISDDKVITDLQTKLQWYVIPNQPTKWHEAKKLVAQLKIDGGQWRMPTRFELQSLYKQGKNQCNIDTTFFSLKQYSIVWSCESCGDRSAGGFNFCDGTVVCINWETEWNKCCAFAVR